MMLVIHRNRMTRIIQVVGHSQDEKKANHERIVEIAAARIRESGTEAPGVAEIMRAAGLTHGGFYKHFGSRDQLVAEAAERAFDASARRTAEALDGAEEPLAAFADFYLSAEHRESAGDGCAVAGLGPDAARGDERIRARFEEGVQSYLALLEDMLGSRKDAVVALSSMVGALLLARAVDDPELSDEFLSGVRERVVTAR
jgi:TetR/AcrR family transcriptional regulator, transcriptional repressor for nem operon